MKQKVEKIDEIIWNTYRSSALQVKFWKFQKVELITLACERFVYGIRAMARILLVYRSENLQSTRDFSYNLKYRNQQLLRIDNLILIREYILENKSVRVHLEMKLGILVSRRLEHLVWLRNYLLVLRKKYSWGGKYFC